jgi:hypothetical protein
MLKKRASRTLLGLGTVTAPRATPPPEIPADVTLPPLLVKNNPTLKEAGTLLFTVKVKSGWFVAPIIMLVPVKPTPLASCPPGTFGLSKGVWLLAATPSKICDELDVDGVKALTYDGITFNVVTVPLTPLMVPLNVNGLMLEFPEILPPPDPTALVENITYPSLP